MTVSSLSKIILGVKNIIVEKVEIKERNHDSQLVISGMKVYVEAEVPRVCFPKHGVVEQ